MGWIADLLKEIPSAARYKAELEDMERDNAALKATNEGLKQQVAALTSEIEKHNAVGAGPGDEMERVLVIVAQNENITAQAVARHLGLKPQIVDMHLEELLASGFIDAMYTAEAPTEYYVQQKGRKHLHAKGLL